MNQLKPLTHSRTSRTRGAYIALGSSIALWFALGAIQTHWLILAVFIIPPSLLAWDLMKNDTAHLTLDHSHLRFGLGTDLDRIPLDQIEVVRLNRRLDFSWRVTLRLKDGRKARIPPPCLPPMEEFEPALQARGVKIDRILFAFTG